MRIDGDLRMVFDVGASKAYHVPLSRDLYDVYYDVIASAAGKLFAKGGYYQVVAAPRIAARVLRDEGDRPDPDTGEARKRGTALLQELQRLTTILVHDDTGWHEMPVAAALARKAIDAEDWDDCEAEIVFFTCHYWMSSRTRRSAVVDAVASAVGASATSLTPTAYCASLTTSTADVPTRQEASSPTASIPQ